MTASTYECVYGDGHASTYDGVYDLSESNQPSSGPIGGESIRHKYLLMPEPKQIVIWRTNASDVVSAMQVVEYAEKRPRKRSGRQSSSQPSVARSITVHLWTDPLDGWEPEEYDTLVFVADGLAIAWVVNTVDTELLGWRWRLSCSKSSTDETLRAQITAALA